MDADLEVYLTNAKAKLANFEEAVGWKSFENETDEELAVCPHDIGHRMTRESLESHTKRCKWKKLGYSDEEIKEIFEEEERTSAMKNASLIYSDSIISRIAPLTPPIRSEKHYKCLLTPQQRLAIYEAEVAECFANNKTQPDKALFADLESKAFEKLYQKENPDNLTETEMLQKMRDMKRRRQSYRAKNVHITKRSQTEIIRGVLAVHMEELSKLWNPETERNYGKSEENYGYKDNREYLDRHSSTDKRYNNDSKTSHDRSRNPRKRSHDDKEARESPGYSGYKSRRPEKYSQERSRSVRDDKSRKDSPTRTRKDETHASNSYSHSSQRKPRPSGSKRFSVHSKDYETSVSETVTKIRSFSDKIHEKSPRELLEEHTHLAEQSSGHKNRTYHETKSSNLNKNLTQKDSEESIPHQSMSVGHPHLAEQTSVLDKKSVQKFLPHSGECESRQKDKYDYSDEGIRSHKHRKKRKKEHSKKHKSKHKRSRSRDCD